MKAHVMILAGAFLATLPAAAQSLKVEKKADAGHLVKIASYSRSYLEKAARAYEKGLKSGNNGVVEACIAYSIVLKLAAPQLDLCDIQAELNDVAVSGNTPIIRYKAYVAMIVFENPRAFENALAVGTVDSNQFFHAVAELVPETLLSYKTE